MMSVEDVIETMHESELEATALLVLESRKLALLLAAWPLIRYQRPDRYELVQTPYWDNLWRLVELPVESTAVVLRCGVGEARSLLRQAVNARLIYPDGTLHRAAATAVRLKLHSALGR